MPARAQIQPLISLPFPRKAGSARAFSLVELLVVIAIIALLIAILVPTLGLVRKAAKKAATQAMLADISRASDSFTVDNRRAPGMIPDSVLYDSSGSGVRALTAMDNAMMELLGGGIRVVRGNTSVLDTVDDAVEIMTDVDTGTQYHASPTLVGEGNYLEVDGSNLARLGADSRLVPEVQGPWDMPTLVDNFGAPILYFRRSGARFSSNASQFDLVGDLIGEGYTDKWYWWDTAHAWGSVGTEAQNPSNFDNSDTGGSWLHYDGSNPDTSAYMAALEHPSLYEDTPRGSYVIISAGPDNTYFNKSQFGGGRGDWRGRFEIYRDANGDPADEDLAQVPIIEETFDEIIVSGG
jgi:prepilin-type N-terminal cleavage/methylation domain-containing protein